NAEVRLEPLEQRLRRLRGITALRRLAPRRDDADFRVLRPGRPRIQVVEGTDAERDEVARQRLRLLEADHARPVRTRRLGLDRRVRDGGVPRRNSESQLPGNLVARLVEAGKGPPRIGGLE